MFRGREHKALWSEISQTAVSLLTCAFLIQFLVRHATRAEMEAQRWLCRKLNHFRPRVTMLLRSHSKLTRVLVDIWPSNNPTGLLELISPTEGGILKLRKWSSWFNGIPFLLKLPNWSLVPFDVPKRSNPCNFWTLAENQCYLSIRDSCQVLEED